MHGRLGSLIGLVVAIAVGLTTRYVPLGFRFWDQDMGDIVSGTAAFFLFAIIFPNHSILRKIVYAFVYCVFVECFKLTGIPMAVRHIAPLRWLLGTTFSLHNLPLYLLGILVAAATQWRRASA